MCLYRTRALLYVHVNTYIKYTKNNSSNCSFALSLTLSHSCALSLPLYCSFSLSLSLGRGEMTEVQPVLDFASSGRSGRRNALPDILGSPAGVNPSDLPLKLTELSLTGQS